MCFLCGNDISQQQYESCMSLLKNEIGNLRFVKSQLETELTHKKIEIDDLSFQLQELKNTEEEKEDGNEIHSGIKFLQDVICKLPNTLEVDKVDEFKKEFKVFLNQNITSEVGYLTNFDVNVLKQQISIDIVYCPYEYDRKDLIVFRELMMQSIHNKELMNEMGWIRNYTTGVDLFISRDEVGFYIRYKNNCDVSYSKYNDAYEYVNTLFLSRRLMD